MTRDYRALLDGVRCWDPGIEEQYRTPPHMLGDAVLQNREELIVFCEFLEEHQIRSYLEIGCWTGRLLETLHRFFKFEKMAVADLGLAQMFGLPLAVPPSTSVHIGSSHAAAYRIWRSALGHFDLVMIDGDHTYEGVKKDFEINRKHPHRFLAFHDISGARPGTEGVRRFWQELGGNKVEIMRPHVEIGRAETTMGIGIWSA